MLPNSVATGIQNHVQYEELRLCQANTLASSELPAL